MVMAMIGPTSFAGCVLSRLNGRLAHVKWALDVFHDHDCVIHHQPTESTIASKVSRLIVKPAMSIRKTAPINEIGMATTG